jgi:hypothetical protein
LPWEANSCWADQDILLFLRNSMAFWAAEIIYHHTLLLCITKVCTNILRKHSASILPAEMQVVVNGLFYGNGIMDNRSGQSEPGVGKWRRSQMGL